MSKLLVPRSVRQALVLALLLFGSYQLSGAATIKAKAWLAPVLIESAWQRTLARGATGDKPWPWADTWPVARLRVPSLGVNLLVLAGDSGNALAFGPGHSPASASPGSLGTAVFGGHRDTHFAFLKALEQGAPVFLELPSGEQREYTVSGARIIDTRIESLDRASLREASHGERLLLVTCYPFDALQSGGPLRYAVSAVAAG